MTDGEVGLDIALCECMCKGREGDRRRESEGGMEIEKETLRDRVRPRAEQEA